VCDLHGEGGGRMKFFSKLLRWLAIPSALPMPSGVAQHGSVVYSDVLPGSDKFWPGAVGETSEKF